MLGSLREKESAACKEGRVSGHFLWCARLEMMHPFTLVEGLVGIPVSEIVILGKKSRNKGQMSEASPCIKLPCPFSKTQRRTLTAYKSFPKQALECNKKKKSQFTSAILAFQIVRSKHWEL